MEIAFTSITVNTSNLQNMLRFYEILGCRFQKVKVSIGSEIFRAEIKNIEFSLISVPTVETMLQPHMLLGFSIQNLETKLAQLKNIPGVLVLLDATDMPDGRKAILQDPDGHSVDLLGQKPA